MAANKFHAMTEGTEAQWREIARADRAYAKELPERMMAQLEMLADDAHGFAIDRLEHCLQAATRALHDGRDEEYVVCALLHDIGDVLAPAAHAEYAALVLRPFVSERNHWMLAHHGFFQAYYFKHLLGGDRDERERYRGHEHFEYTAEFCDRYDQNCFDPHYRSLPLAEFAPMLRRVLSPERLRPE